MNVLRGRKVFNSASAKPTVNGHDNAKPAAVQKSHPRTSKLLDPSDPVAMHLLMETAMGDSRNYQVLSVEEAEGLRKEVPLLGNRVEATKRQLAIESKVRDAAASLNKLERGPGGKSESEIAAAREKCDRLTQDLAQLERKHQDIQAQLYEHTAGVLQMTHKGYLDDEAPQPQTNGVSGHSKGYDGLSLTHFDDHSFYQTLDSVLGDGMGGAGSAAFKKNNEAIVKTERKLWDLNQRLRDAINQFNTDQSPLPPPPQPRPDGSDADEAMQQQVSYLERGLRNLQRDGSSQREEKKKLESLSTAVGQLVAQQGGGSKGASSVPRAGASGEDHLKYIQQGLGDIGQKFSVLRNDHQSLSSKSATYEEKATRHENLMQDLWQNISDGEKFSADAFGSKVSSLSNKVADLSNQKDILNRQIQQQREINSKADGAKDAEKSKLVSDLEAAKQETERAQKDLKDREGEIARLQMEVTVARAELDGAYGTRAQRAAEASENGELQQKVQTLQKELAETIAEYEVMTKSSIEFEKERENLEITIDGLRDKCEALESEMSEERVNKLGSKSPGTPGDRGSNDKGATSTSVLKNEFKKMMRETRAENLKALKSEQEERRKLEAQIRELKKAQTPGKSSLSQSVSAS